LPKETESYSSANHNKKEVAGKEKLQNGNEKKKIIIMKQRQCRRFKVSVLLHPRSEIAQFDNWQRVKPKLTAGVQVNYR